MSKYEDRAAAMARTRDNPFERQLPANIEAEQALLGALLVNNAALARVPETMSPDYISEPLHRKIFEATKDLIKAGKVASPVTVKTFLPAGEKIGDLTVSQYMARLASDAASIIHVPDLSDAVTTLAMGRLAIGLGQDLTEAGYISFQRDQFRQRVAEIREDVDFLLRTLDYDEKPQSSFADSVDESLDKTGEAAAGREPIGIDPGLPEIYSLTGPWQKGQLIIIGGGVKQGKSALAMQSMFTIAEKHAVGCNSGEMSKTQLIMREKARRTGISASRQQRGSVSEHEFQELVQAGAEMKHLQHINIDCRRMTLQQIDDQIGRLIGEKGIETYFLDHIGKIQWNGKMEYEDEFKQGQRATSMLKDMAQKHGIPIVALTHLKKSTFQDYQGRSFRDRVHAAINRRPTYRDLVGNMDKDADQVLIVFQAKPIVAGMEPEEGSSDYAIWQEAMEKVNGKADIILSLSRESEFPRRKEIQWNGATTSYGAPFKQVQNDRGLF
jgi:replicative DNA helicase